MKLSTFLVGSLAALAAALPMIDSPEPSALAIIEEVVDVPTDIVDVLGKRAPKKSPKPPKTPKASKTPKPANSNSKTKSNGAVATKSKSAATSAHRTSAHHTTTKGAASARPTTVKGFGSAHTSGPRTKSKASVSSHAPSGPTSIRVSASSNPTAHRSTVTKSHTSLSGHSTGVKSASTRATRTSKSATASSTSANFLCEKGSCGKGSCPIKPKKPTPKQTTPAKTSRSLTSTVDYFAKRAYNLVTRAADEITLTPRAIFDLADPNVLLEESQPNDMAWDSWKTSAFNRRVEGLGGCTTVFITSPVGVFTWHIWEFPVFRTNHRMIDEVMDAKAWKLAVTDQAAKGRKNGKFENMTFKDQFGMKDSQVPENAWSSVKDIHISIVTPNHHDTNLPMGSPWNLDAGLTSGGSTTGLRYSARITELISTIKSTIGDVPAAHIGIYKYHAMSNNPDRTPSGMATLVWNGKNYAVFGEGTKMMEVEVGTPTPPINNCDDSASCSRNCCAILKKL